MYVCVMFYTYFICIFLNVCSSCEFVVETVGLVKELDLSACKLVIFFTSSTMTWERVVMHKDNLFFLTMDSFILLEE